MMIDYHIADGAETPHVAIFEVDEEGNETKRLADIYDLALGNHIIEVLLIGEVQRMIVERIIAAGNQRLFGERKD